MDDGTSVLIFAEISAIGICPQAVPKNTATKMMTICVLVFWVLIIERADKRKVMINKPIKCQVPKQTDKDVSTCKIIQKDQKSRAKKVLMVMLKTIQLRKTFPVRFENLNSIAFPICTKFSFDLIPVSGNLIAA